jgi:hypothetical protein
VARPNLRVIDGAGEDVSADPAAVISALHAALARADKTIQGLKAQLVDKRANAPRKKEIEEIFEEWKWALKKPRLLLTDDRFDAIEKYLDKGCTREHFTLMIEALVAYPHVVYGKRRSHGSADSVETDIGYVLEKGRRFEELVNLGHQARRANALPS